MFMKRIFIPHYQHISITDILCSPVILSRIIVKFSIIITGHKKYDRIGKTVALIEKKLIRMLSVLKSEGHLDCSVSFRDISEKP